MNSITDRGLEGGYTDSGTLEAMDGRNRAAMDGKLGDSWNGIVALQAA